MRGNAERVDNHSGQHPSKIMSPRRPTMDRRALRVLVACQSPTSRHTTIHRSERHQQPARARMIRSMVLSLTHTSHGVMVGRLVSRSGNPPGLIDGWAEGKSFTTLHNKYSTAHLQPALVARREAKRFSRVSLPWLAIGGPSVLVSILHCRRQLANYIPITEFPSWPCSG